MNVSGVTCTTKQQKPVPTGQIVLLSLVMTATLVLNKIFVKVARALEHRTHVEHPIHSPVVFRPQTVSGMVHVGIR